MDKALNYLALAKKGRLCELGEEPVGDITRALKGHLVLVAADASDHTWRRAKSYVAGTDQQALRVKFTKEELGMTVGRQSLAIAAVTDPALGTKGHHCRVNRLQIVDVMLLFQLLHQFCHDHTAGQGIVRRPVVIELRQAQGIGDNIQLELT